MLRTIKDLHGRTVAARDGEIGCVDEVYFDDEAWAIRYLVIETGTWLSKRRVLISPYSVKHADPRSDPIHVDLTRQQIRDSPDIDTHKPVSRQHEAEYLRYYGYPMYWGGPNLWGMSAYPAPGLSNAAPGVISAAREQLARYGDRPPGDVHLRSTTVVEHCHIEAADGGIGHVCGFIFDDVAWDIRYMIVDTENLWPGGRKVLLATQWIDLIDWFSSAVSTTLTRDAIRNCPAYDDSLKWIQSSGQR